jgi:hypothetical protein
MWVVSESDKYIATTWGSTVSLTAGEPVQVGHDIGLLCLQNGCTEVKETPVQTQVVEDLVKTLDVVIEATSVNLEDMTKGQLEEHGRTMGMELDKRKKKAVLIEEIKAAQ